MAPDLAGIRRVVADAGGPEAGADLVDAHELHRGAERVAGRAGEQATAESGLFCGVDRDGRPRQWRLERALVQDIRFLAAVLDRIGARLAHLTHGLGRLLAELDEQPCGDDSGAPQPAAAMDEDAPAEREFLPQARSGLRPGALPGAAGHPAIDDGQDEMLDPGRHVPGKIRDAEHGELMVLHQADHHGGAPFGDFREVGVEVALPVARDRAGDALARAQGHADQATEVTDGHGVDAQGMGFARFFHGWLPYFLV